MNAITNRAFLTALTTGTLVINTEDGKQVSKSIFNEDGSLITEMTDFAKASIEKLDKKNGSRKMTASQLANEKLKADIVASLEVGKAYTAKDISELFNISTQKVSAMARQLVESGVMTVSEVKGEKGKVKGYTIVEGAVYEPKSDSES